MNSVCVYIYSQISIKSFHFFVGKKKYTYVIPSQNKNILMTVSASI